MGWIFLLSAGVLEIAFTTFLKLSQNFTVIRYSIIFAVCAIASFLCLNKAINLNIPLGTAYAIWTGIGAAGTVIIGIFLFNEPSDFLRIMFLTLLIGSIVGLKFVAPS
jgi:quaternary ammonium compound-resistance protein SugE